MGSLLKWVGGLWALLGAFTVVSIMMGERSVDDTGAIILAFVLMILPGLAVYGIGARITKAKVVERSLRPCPFCAEMIQAEARVCRFCQRELTPPELKKPVA